MQSLWKWGLLLFCKWLNCAPDVGIRIDQLQTLHAHNAYHACPLPNMVALFSSPIGSVVTQAIVHEDPGELMYGHEPLLTLVKDRGVRSIELDLYFDPEGGRYAYRSGPKVAKALHAWPDDSNREGGPDLFTPGSKVMHIPDVDFQATCDSLVPCLAPIAAWSRENPTHSPLFVLLEIKTWNIEKYLTPFQRTVIDTLLNNTAGAPTTLTSTPPVNASHLHMLEAEILSVFDRSQIFTPDKFRLTYPSLQDRIAEAGWPTLEELRGRVIFRTLPWEYSRILETEWPGGRGGLLFKEASIWSLPFVPDMNTVFASMDFGVRNLPNVSTDGAGRLSEDSSMRANRYRLGVEQVVQTGQIMLRASGDMGAVQARQNFNGFAAAAAAGGAHFVHTDYPNGATSQCGFTSPYTVRVAQIKPGTWNNSTLSSVNTTRWGAEPSSQLASACNPVTAPSTCTTWAEGGQPAGQCTCYSPL